MDGGVIAGIIGGITTLLGGVWLLFRYVIKTFLDHIEKKNGHLERIAKNFNDTIGETLEGLKGELRKANENQMNIIGVLNESARALNEHHKH